MFKKIISLFVFIGILTTHSALGRDKMPQEIASQTAEVVFAMGCFWCGETEFRDHETNQLLPGIQGIRVGFAGGTNPNPTYENHDGYKEAVKVIYDPKVISLEKLLDIFWYNVDATDAGGQFCDRGYPYTSVVYYKTPQEKALIYKKKDQFQKLISDPIVTEVVPFTTFYDAEDYHQNYKSKNPIRYKYYRWNCGRDKRLEELWGRARNYAEPK